MTLLIMAAGMGSRFGGLKQIEPIGPNGEFIIDYSIYDAIEAGFTKVVFVIKEENYEIFKNTIGKRFENKIEVAYAFQKQDNIPDFIKTDRTKPWGTGHAILAAKDLINDNFGIINADDFYGRDAYTELAKFLNSTSDNNYAMIGYKVKNTVSSNGTVKRGVCTNEEGILTNIIESNITVTNDKYIMNPLNSTEESYITEDTLVSMNMFGFTPTLFSYLEKDIVNFFESNINNIDKCEYLIPIIVNDMIHNNSARVKVIETTSKWLGMTYKEDKEELVYNIIKMIEEGIYPNKI